ncbi:hypothetical protein HDU93_006091, partial [Gonapodya sp. JEL0774]
WPKWPTLKADDAAEPTSRYIQVVVAGNVYPFPVEFKNERTSAVEDLMGPLSKIEWAVQRGWGFKRSQKDPTNLSISYIPKPSDYRTLTAGGFGYVQF